VNLSAHRSWRVALCPLLVGAYLAAALPAQAAPARSRTQRETDARKACTAGRVDEGIELLAELFAETEHPNYIYNQARCYQENGRNDQAISRFREFLRVAPLTDTEVRARTEHYIQELEGSPRPARQSPPPPEPRPLPPMRSEAPPPAPVPLAPAPRQQPPRSSSGLGVAAATLGIVGAVAIVAGVVSGLEVQSLSHKAEDAKLGMLSVDDLASNADKAHRFEVFQWIGYGIGGAALLGALVCVAVDRKSPSESRASNDHRILPVAGLIGGGPAVGLSGRF
jgi:hypothetical protein